MRGASQESLTRLRGEVVAGSADDGVATELLAVADLLGRERGLRAALTDASAPPDARAGIVTTLLQGKVSEATLSLLQRAVRLRWSHPLDLADAAELLGAATAFSVAEREGTLDAVEDELFRFGRTVEAEPDLRRVLGNHNVEPERKVAILRDLVATQVQPLTLTFLEQVVRSPRGRQLEEAVHDLVQLASERNEELMGEVRVAAPMTAEQEQRMAEALGRVYSRRVRLQVVVDPTVLGGAVVTVGDEVIDGSIAHKLEQARRRMVG